jgi:type IV pilus assembly protein PilV
MMMKQPFNQNGFTLIEVLTAMLILAFGILGVAIMQSTSIEGNNTANRLTAAAVWGEETIERLMARPFNHIDLTDSSNIGANAGTTGLNNTDGVGNLADGGPVVQGNYTIFWNVADNCPVLGTKTIRVIVRRFDNWAQKTVTYDYIKMEPI